jgi:cytochrome c-type biogenesis protein CcmE
MRRLRLLIAAVVVIAALLYLIIGGIRTSIVYYITPSELLAQGEVARGKTIRLGGQVQPGSKVWDPNTQELRFTLTDGTAGIPVIHRGTPPGLFSEGQGAVVEGTFQPHAIFMARSIIVKHSEEYAPPSPRP